MKQPIIESKPNYEHRLEQMVRERIVRDLAKHVVTVLKNDGLYRHWRCNAPGTWVMGFSIVTWPGSLCFTGDMGDYLFQRTEDMVAFMRGSCMSYSYAAEKCVAHDGRLTEWRHELFEEALQQRLLEAQEYSPERAVEVAEKIDEARRAYVLQDVHVPFPVVPARAQVVLRTTGVTVAGSLNMTPREQQLERDFIAAIRTAPDVSLQLTATEAVSVVGFLQLALRHPQISSTRNPSTKLVRHFIDQVRRQVPEALQRTIDAGFNPKFDR